MGSFARQAARRRKAVLQRHHDLLAPRQPERLRLRLALQRQGLADAALEAELESRLGRVTDEERSLELRIARENELIARALVALGPDRLQAELRLVCYLDEHFGPSPHGRVYVRDLTDAQLDQLELWLAVREAGRRDADR
jgi:predicted RecB family nuclease